MKIKLLLASSVSLVLVACQVSAPLTAPTLKSTTQNRVTMQSTASANTKLPIKSSGLGLQSTATVTQANNQEEMTLQIALPKASEFKTQVTDLSRLRYVKVSLTGQGITGTMTHNGNEFLSATGDTISAQISKIPLSDGKIRVVKVQGFDQNFIELPAFGAGGYYVSQKGVNSITLNLGHAQLLIANVLNVGLSETAKLESINLSELESTLSGAVGLNNRTGEIQISPIVFNATDIWRSIPPDGSSIPSANDIINLYPANLQTVSLEINAGSSFLGEPVMLVLDDPNSMPLYLSVGSPSTRQVMFAGVPAGNWFLKAYDQNGTLLATTPVTVTDSNFDVTSPFVLSGLDQLDGEFKANTTTTDDQSSGEIATDADGDYVVVWESYDQSNDFNVYGQRYDSLGIALGNEFPINTFTSGDQKIASVAMNDAGDFVVAWQSNGQAGDGNNSIYARRYSSTGAALDTSEFLVNTVTSNEQEDPSVGMDASGDFVIAWQSDNQGGYGPGVYARRYNAAGVAQDVSEFKVNDYTTDSQFQPEVAIDDSGDFAITWVSDNQDSSDSYGVYARTYNAAGTATSSEFQVNTNNTETDQTSPDIAMDADGDFVVTWQSFEQVVSSGNNGIFAQRFNSVGSAQGSEFKVFVNTNVDQTAPSAAMDADGDFVISWNHTDGDGSGIHARRFNRLAISQGPEFNVNIQTSSDQIQSQAAMTNNGEFVIIWNSFNQDGFEFGVFGQRYTALGMRAMAPNQG